jgi:hypothetical protein
MANTALVDHSLLRTITVGREVCFMILETVRFLAHARQLRLPQERAPCYVVDLTGAVASLSGLRSNARAHP